MENKETFKMNYSAEQQEELQLIRKKYMEKEEDKMEQLRKLDSSAGKKAAKAALSLGTVGALVMGAGMSMVMTDFGNLLGSYRFFVGIAAGIIGIAILACAYPLYERTLKEERERIAPEILRMTDELMK